MMRNDAKAGEPLDLLHKLQRFRKSFVSLVYLFVPSGIFPIHPFRKLMERTKHLKGRIGTHLLNDHSKDIAVLEKERFSLATNIKLPSSSLRMDHDGTKALLQVRQQAIPFLCTFTEKSVDKIPRHRWS